MRDPILRDPSDFKDVSAVTVTTATSVWDPGTSQLRFMGFDLSVSAEGSIVFTEETTNRVLYRTPVLPANTPVYRDLYSEGVLLVAGKDLKAQLSVAGSITGTLLGDVRAPG